MRNRFSIGRNGWQWLGVFILAVAIAGFRLVETVGPERSPGDRFVVNRVLDGDTVELLGGDRLRLRGIDTPEKGEPLYDEATKFLRNLTLGKTISLEYGSVRRDRYGRLLAFVFVDDTLLVNRAILAAGLANLYLFKDTPMKHPAITAMFEAQWSAIDSRLGLMGLPREVESVYLASKGSYRFHRPLCRSLRPENLDQYAQFDFRRQALYEGLSPCRNCKP